MNRKEEMLGTDLIRRIEEIKKNPEYVENLCCYAYENLSDMERLICYIGQLEGALRDTQRRLAGCQRVLAYRDEKVKNAKDALKALFEL